MHINKETATDVHTLRLYGSSVPGESGCECGGETGTRIDFNYHIDNNVDSELSVIANGHALLQPLSTKVGRAAKVVSSSNTKSGCSDVTHKTQPGCLGGNSVNLQDLMLAFSLSPGI